MLRSNSSAVERLYSRAGRDNRSVLFSSCPAGSRKAINLLESQSKNETIEEPKRMSFSMFTLRTLAEAIGLAEQFKDMSMMGEAVKQGGRQALISKDLHPISKFQVGGDDQGETLVEFGAEREERLGAILRKGDEAEFIQNHQIQFEGGSNNTVQAMFILGLDQFIHQTGGGPEAYAASLAAGRGSQADGKMSLAETGVADQDQTLFLLDVLAACQIKDLGFVEQRQAGEVEICQFFDDREAGGLQALLQDIELALVDFLFCQRQQETQRILVIARRVCSELGIEFDKGGQTQLPQIRIEKRVAFHYGLPSSS